MTDGSWRESHQSMLKQILSINTATSRIANVIPVEKKYQDNELGLLSIDYATPTGGGPAATTTNSPPRKET
jgi:hypothetical protein